MSDESGAELAALRRRLERERAARREAETIAERVTAELYASKSALTLANDELQALNQSLREFVAIASHDLRNPLTAILGLSATLETKWERIPEESRTEFFGMIRRKGEDLTRMTDDLLTVSRIEAGQLDLHAEVVKLHDAVATAIESFAQHRTDIVLDVDDAEVVADPFHLQRILANFVGNALKYGGPPVEVEAHENGAWTEILVRDHGDGVPADLVPRLFGKFARGEAAREKGGTGLGLSIVQGLARANGGDTWYEPVSPHGSCFGVRLPRTAA